MAIKRKYFVLTVLLTVIIVIIIFGTSRLSGSKNEKVYVVKKGRFEAVLDCKGEINGSKATEIKAPKVLGDRDLRIWGLQITDLVQDGKSVKKGDFIMQLDVSTISSGNREERQKMEKEQADLNNARIDSTVKLNEMREEIKNALLDLEYNKIDLEQSVFESEAYQRKAQMTYQKALNNIAKKRRDYQLEQNKLKTRVQRAEENVEISKVKLDKFRQAMRAARITAPEDGIVIIGKNWDGKKFSKDDRVSTHMYAPPYATLPDMSEVISETFVKEIDIAKINIGDTVRVTFDAVEELVIMGKIKYIARVGEDHKSYDMKVFKVLIEMERSDERLKPAMTSNNEILLSSSENALFAPLNAVYKSNGTDYVYVSVKGEVSKRTIKTGLENEEFIEIISGLEEGEKILLTPPEEMEIAMNE